jgi:hypothetical protein
MDEATPNDALITAKMPRMTDACPACPVEVRGLYAAAHNAVGAFERAMSGTGDAERAVRKLAELRDAVAKMKPIVEAHFADPAHSKIFRDR